MLSIFPPESFNSIFSIDELLKNNQARWSPTNGRLYISLAAKTLILDSETDQAPSSGSLICVEL
jgi:hypothetical protein